MRRPEKIHWKEGKVCWQLRYRDGQGNMRYKRFDTRRGAEEFAAEVKRLQASGIDPGRRITFQQLATEWRAAHLATGLRASSVKDYEASLKRMEQEFGPRELRSIRAADLEALRNRVIDSVRTEATRRFEKALARARAKPEERRTDCDRRLLAAEPETRRRLAERGPRTAAKLVGAARTLWRRAVREGYVARNIAESVRKPPPERSVETALIDQNILTPAEIARLTQATPAEHRCAVQFLFLTGCRIAELRGLMWTDFEFDRARVLIRRQRSGMTGELTAPKTPAGTRWIDLPAELVGALRLHKAATGGEFAFPIDERNWRQRVWHPALRRAGLRAVRIHDARHTHASLLIAAGADVVAVSRRLGHANPSVTLTVYSHAFARRDAAPLGEQLAAFMARESGGCAVVVPADRELKGRTEVVELMVARGGIELPTRGFSVHVPKRAK